MIAVLFGCATTPEGRQQQLLVSDAQMNEMGLAASAQMKANQSNSGHPFSIPDAATGG